MAFRKFEKKKSAKGNSLQDYKPVIYYDYHDVDQLLFHLQKLGYECTQVWEGSLGSGNWICKAPDDRHYNFTVEEVSINPWSSAHKVHRKKKLNAADLAQLERKEVI